MRDRGYLTLVAGVSLLLGMALAAPAAAAQPKLVPAETKIDFGEASQGTEVPFEFILRNEGDAPLTIDEVKPSCGCTAALASDSTVAPGGEARVTGTVKTAGFQDRITKTITVTSNDPDRARMTLTITGIVQVPFHLEPRYINFGQVKRGEAAQRVATLTVKDDARLPAAVGEPTVRSPHLTASVVPRAGEDPARTFDITVDLAGDAPQGQISTPVLIPVEGEEQPLRLTVYANVVGDVAIYPQTVSLGLVEEGKEVVRSFVVMSPTQKKFEIADAQCDLPGCVVEVTELPNQASRRRITVKLDGSGLPDGRVEGTLTVITTMADAEPLTARLIGSVKRMSAPAAPETLTPLQPAAQPTATPGA